MSLLGWDLCPLPSLQKHWPCRVLDRGPRSSPTRLHLPAGSQTGGGCCLAVSSAPKASRAPLAVSRCRFCLFLKGPGTWSERPLDKCERTQTLPTGSQAGPCCAAAPGPSSLSVSVCTMGVPANSLVAQGGTRPPGAGGACGGGGPRAAGARPHGHCSQAQPGWPGEGLGDQLPPPPGQRSRPGTGGRRHPCPQWAPFSPC